MDIIYNNVASSINNYVWNEFLVLSDHKKALGEARSARASYWLALVIPMSLVRIQRLQSQ